MIIDIFQKAGKDEIPNVRFCLCRIIEKHRATFDNNVYQNTLCSILKELLNDSDKDVQDFAKTALAGS